jgi:hypothetical protein
VASLAALARERDDHLDALRQQLDR